ncbi:flavin reductase family protein [Actinomadura sp. BRA 177]|nr:flavin reductase family protein [Actinomadura sp. BRA 177]
MRRTFGTFATGVTVVTVGGAAPHAMTANAFTSVSLDPPLVLVCVGHDAVMHDCMAAGRFGVSVLSDGQEAVARHFADRGRPLGAAQFSGVGCRTGPLTGAPLIEGALAHIECEVQRRCDGGDHTIFIGRLLGMDLFANGDPLLFYRGRFRLLEPERSEVKA